MSTLSAQPTRAQRHLTLVLVTILHACTHVYTMVLVPLYLQLRRDLGLTSDAQVTLLVTLQGLAYCGASLPLGIMADKMSRKRLLSLGLLLNAVAFAGLAFAPSYGWALFWVAIAGFCGSFYHPSATALVVALFPNRPGQALGRVGMGAAFGFFFGPIYAGWRGQSVGWRQACLELAIAGIVIAVLFELLAREPHDAPHLSARRDADRTRNLWPLLLAVGVVALVFSVRDFGAGGMVTLSSLFLQRAHGFDSKTTGFYLGLLFLAGILSNPLIGALSDRRRVPAMVTILLITGACAVAVPFWPRQWVWVGLTIYGFFIISSFPIVEAALMENVPDALRGRTFGMFITVVGIISSVAHWAMGHVADSLRGRSIDVTAYMPWFGMLGLLIALGIAGIPMLGWLRNKFDAHGERAARQAAASTETAVP